MSATIQIAEVLNVSPNQIKSVREMAWVYCVVVFGKRATFVSKKKVNLTIEQVTAEVAAKLQSQGVKQAQAWVKYGKARVYVWEREFVEVALNGSVKLGNVATGTYKSRIITACLNAGIPCGYQAA